jgi:hypothetical protein
MYGLPDSAIVGTIKRFKPRRRGGGPRVPSRGSYNPRISIKTKTTFTYTFGGLKFREQELYKELQTSSGGLWRYLEVQGAKAVAGAQRKVGVKTGALRKSIHKRHLGYTVSGGGQYLMVGSWTVPYAELHHRGTKPHLITPKATSGAGKGVLTFSSKKGGIVYTTAVLHPGTKPNNYLSSQLYHFRGVKTVPASALNKPIPKGLI